MIEYDRVQIEYDFKERKKWFSNNLTAVIRFIIETVVTVPPAIANLLFKDAIFIRSTPRIGALAF